MITATELAAEVARRRIRQGLRDIVRDRPLETPRRLTGGYSGPAFAALPEAERFAIVKRSVARTAFDALVRERGPVVALTDEERRTLLGE